MEQTTKNSAKAKVTAALDEALAMDAKIAGMKFSKKDMGKVVCHAKDPNNCRFHCTGKYSKLTHSNAFSKEFGECSKDDIQDYINEALEAKGIKSQVSLESWGDKGNGFKVDWQHPKGTGEEDKWDAKGALEEILPNDASMDAVDDNDLDHSWFHVEGFVNAEEEDLANGGAATGNENPELEDMVAKEGDYKPDAANQNGSSFSEEEQGIMDAFADVCEGENVAYENPEWDQVDGNLTCTLEGMKADKGIAAALAVSMESKLKEMGYPDADVQVNDADGGFTFVIGAGEKEETGAGSGGQNDLFGGKQQGNGGESGQGEGGLPPKDAVDAAVNAFYDWTQAEKDDMDAVDMCCGALNDLMGKGLTTEDVDEAMLATANEYIEQMASAMDKGETDAAQQSFEKLQEMFDGIGGDDGQKSPYLPANEADMATGDVVSQTAENIMGDKFPNMEISAECEETKPGVYEFQVTGYDTDDDPGELAEELQKALGEGWTCQADGSTVVCTAKTEDGATGNQGKADYESAHESVSAYLSGKTADDDNLDAKMKACEDLSALTGLTVDPGNVTDDVMQNAQSLLADIQSCEQNGDSAGVEELSGKLKDLFQGGGATGNGLHPDAQAWLDQNQDANVQNIMKEAGVDEATAKKALAESVGEINPDNLEFEKDTGSINPETYEQVMLHAKEKAKAAAAAGAKGSSSTENGAAAGASGQQQEEDEDAYSLNPDCDLSDFLDNAPGLMEKYGDAEGVKDAHDKLQAAYGNYQKVNESIEGMQELVDSGAVPQSVMNQLHDAANGHASECDKHMATMQGAIKAHKEKLAAAAKTDEDSPALDPNVDFDEFKGKHADALAKKYSSAEGFGVAHDKFANANKKADEVAKSLEQVKQMAENGLVPQSVVDDLQKAHQGHLDEAKKQMSAMQEAVKAHKAKAGAAKSSDMKGSSGQAVDPMKELAAGLPSDADGIKKHAEFLAKWADEQIDGTQFHAPEYNSLLKLYHAASSLQKDPANQAAKDAIAQAKKDVQESYAQKGSGEGGQVPDAVVHALSSGKVANTNGVVSDGKGGAIVKLKPGTSLGQAQNALNALTGELDGFGSAIVHGADGEFQIKLHPKNAGAQGAGGTFDFKSKDGISKFLDGKGLKYEHADVTKDGVDVVVKKEPGSVYVNDVVTAIENGYGGIHTSISGNDNSWVVHITPDGDAGGAASAGGTSDLDFGSLGSGYFGQKLTKLGLTEGQKSLVGKFAPVTEGAGGFELHMKNGVSQEDAQTIANQLVGKFGNVYAVATTKGDQSVIMVKPSKTGATGGTGSSSYVYGTMDDSSPAATAANWDKKTGSFFHDTSKDAFDFAIGTKQFDGTDLEKGSGFLTYDEDLGGSILHLPDGSDHKAVGAVLDKLEKKYGNIVAKPVFGNGGKASIEITPKLSMAAQKWAEGMAPKLKNDFGGIHESHILSAIQKALKTNPVQFGENGVNNMGLPQVVAFNKAVQKNLVKAGHLKPKAPTSSSIYPTLGGFSHSEPQKTSDGGYELHVTNLTDKTFAKMQPQLEKDHPGFTVSKDGAAVKFTPVFAKPAAASASPATGASASFTGGKKKYWESVGTDVAKGNIKGVPPAIAVKAFEDTLAALPDHAFDENGHMTASFNPNKVIKDAKAAAQKLFEPVKSDLTKKFGESAYGHKGVLSFTPEGAAKITCTEGSWIPKTSKAGIEAAFPGYSVSFTNKNKNAILTKKEGAGETAPLKGGKFWSDFPKGNLKKYLDQKMSGFTDQLKQFHHGMSKDTITKALNAAFHEIGLSESDVTIEKNNGQKSYTIPSEKFEQLSAIAKDKAKLEQLAKSGTPLSPTASAPTPAAKPSPAATGSAQPASPAPEEPPTGALPAAAAKWHDQFGKAFLGQEQFAEWDQQHVSDALKEVLGGPDVKFGKTADGKAAVASKVKGKTLSMLVKDQLKDVPKKSQPVQETAPTPKVDLTTAKCNVLAAPDMAKQIFGGNGLTPQEKNGKAIAHLEGLMTAAKSAELKNTYQNLIAKLSQQQYDADGNPKA